MLEDKRVEKIIRTEVECSGLGISWADVCMVTDPMTDQEAMRLGNPLTLVQMIKKVGWALASQHIPYNMYTHDAKRTKVTWLAIPCSRKLIRATVLHRACKIVMA